MWRTGLSGLWLIVHPRQFSPLATLDILDIGGGGLDPAGAGQNPPSVIATAEKSETTGWSRGSGRRWTGALAPYGASAARHSRSRALNENLQGPRLFVPSPCFPTVSTDFLLTTQPLRVSPLRIATPQSLPTAFFPFRPPPNTPSNIWQSVRKFGPTLTYLRYGLYGARPTDGPGRGVSSCGMREKVL